MKAYNNGFKYSRNKYVICELIDLIFLTRDRLSQIFNDMIIKFNKFFVKNQIVNDISCHTRKML